MKEEDKIRDSLLRIIRAEKDCMEAVRVLEEAKEHLLHARQAEHEARLSGGKALKSTGRTQVVYVSRLYELSVHDPPRLLEKSFDGWVIPDKGNQP